MRKIAILISAVVVILLAYTGYQQSHTAKVFVKSHIKTAVKRELINSDKSLAEVIDSLNVKQESLSIFIDKSDYQLSVKSGAKTLKIYPVVFGGNPTDDKLKEGDQCTPEGTFHIVDKYPHRSWNKFIWLNYPTNSSWEKHNKAKENGLIPKDASIGGEIGIHGTTEDNDHLVDKQVNWTLGCISMRNADLDELYPFILKNTPIHIYK